MSEKNDFDIAKILGWNLAEGNRGFWNPTGSNLKCELPRFSYDLNDSEKYVWPLLWRLHCEWRGMEERAEGDFKRDIFDAFMSNDRTALVIALKVINWEKLHV